MHCPTPLLCPLTQRAMRRLQEENGDLRHKLELQTQRLELTMNGGGLSLHHVSLSSASSLQVHLPNMFHMWPPCGGFRLQPQARTAPACCCMLCAALIRTCCCMSFAALPPPHRPLTSSEG